MRRFPRQTQHHTTATSMTAASIIPNRYRAYPSTWISPRIQCRPGLKPALTVGGGAAKDSRTRFGITQAMPPDLSRRGSQSLSSASIRPTPAPPHHKNYGCTYLDFPVESPIQALQVDNRRPLRTLYRLSATPQVGKSCAVRYHSPVLTLRLLRGTMHREGDLPCFRAPTIQESSTRPPNVARHGLRAAHCPPTRPAGRLLPV